MTDRETTERAARAWVRAYVEAWASNDPDAIRGLFTEDADYRTEPWLEPTAGHADIVSQWLDRRDEPGSFEFEWDLAGVDRARAFVQAVTRYAHGTIYSNLWVIDFAEDGRANSFTEWWMDQSEAS